jgi:hypothetical protein
VWADPGTVHSARCLGHENLVVLDGSGCCPLGRLGDGPGTVLVRGDRLVVGAPADGEPATAPVSAGRTVGPVSGLVVGTSIRGGRAVVVLDVDGLRLRAWSDGSPSVGDRVGVSVAEGGVVPLSR